MAGLFINQVFSFHSKSFSDLTIIAKIYHFHIFQRANNREACFYSSEVSQYYREILKFICKKQADSLLCVTAGDDYGHNKQRDQKSSIRGNRS